VGARIRIMVSLSRVGSRCAVRRLLEEREVADVCGTLGGVQRR
jgi:hypothetical protein